MTEKAFQDYYPDFYAQCYGCGRLNDMASRSRATGMGSIGVHLYARPYHTAIPGYVYGGLIASLIDCHSTGTAAAAACGRQAGTCRRSSHALLDCVTTCGLPASYAD